MPIEPAGLLQDAVHRGWGDGHDIVVEHHEGQPPIAVQRVSVVIGDDGFFLPLFQPPITRNFAIVLVGLTVAVLPLMELTRTEVHPAKQPFGCQLGTVGPVFDVSDDFVPDIVGNPNSF